MISGRGNWSGSRSSLMDAVWALVAIVGLILPFALLQLWGWVSLIVAVAIAVGTVEFVWWKQTGRTVSQQFWAFRKQHRKTSWVLLALLALVWVALLVHLGWK